MTIERPMFPPRAESVDSFSHQPAIGQPEGQALVSESRKPVKGLSRRAALAGVAMLPARVVGIPAAAEAAADPAFALIAAKLAADVAHCEAIDAQDEAEDRHGNDSQEAWDANETCAAKCHEVNVIDWELARTPPQTLAGVAAVLRFANEIEDGGMEWPNTDTIGREGWHYQLRATMAAAIEALIKSGKAVQS
jgi:hypothetical protein